MTNLFKSIKKKKKKSLCKIHRYYTVVLYENISETSNTL
jgi:hypothetical protein